MVLEQYKGLHFWINYSFNGFKVIMSKAATQTAL